MLQVSGNTLQQLEMFKYLRKIFTSDRKQNKEIDTGIGKANAVLRELYRSVVTKLEFQTPQSCQLFDRSLLRTLPMFTNLGQSLKEYYPKYKRHNGVYGKCPRRDTLREKMCSCESCRTLNVEPQNAHEGLAESCWLCPR